MARNFFYVEPFDEEVLKNPQSYILDRGGYIFFIKEDEKVVGTVALMKKENNIFELTKMAVIPKHQGKQLGQQLVQFCMDFARNQEFEKLILYSNTKLENAIYIYKKLGFKEVAIEANNPYARGNIKMEYLVS